MSPDVSYVWSARRAGAAAAVLGLAAAVVAQVVVAVVLTVTFGPAGPSVLGPAVIFVVVYTVVFAPLSVLLERPRPTRLRLGDDGLELAAARRDGVLVPLTVIEVARVRGCWPIVTLQVTVPAAQVAQVPRLTRGGRKPLRRRRGGHVRFVVPLAGLDVSSGAVAAELRTRGLPQR